MDHGKPWPEEEMCHKKVEKMMKIVKIGIFGKMIPHHPGNISRVKKPNFDEEIDVFKINGAKHSPSPLPLCRPSADFGGPRAGA